MEQSTKCAEIFHLNGQLKYLCLLCSNYEEGCQQFEEHFYSAHLKDLIASNDIKNDHDDDLFSQETVQSNPIKIPSSNEKHSFEIVEIVEIKEEFDDETELLQNQNNKEIQIDKNSKDNIAVDDGTVLLIPGENINKNQQINHIDNNSHDKDTILVESNLKCEYCNLQFEYVAQLQKHVWRFKELKYKCTECNEQICGPQLFKTHMKLRHHFVMSSKCKKKLLEKEKKQRPKQNRKPSTKLYKCDICNKVCREFCNLKTHMRLHTGEKPYSCDQCDRRFNENSSLTMHIRHHHTKDRPFQCTECGACFGFLRTLNAHIRRCHEKDKDTLAPCPICAKIYRGKRNLKNHIRTHSTERPYSCNQCNKTFKDRKILSQHSKLHTETKSYPCPFCELSFAQWAGRRGHIRRMHEGK